MIELRDITEKFPDVEFTFKHHGYGMELVCSTRSNNILSRSSCIINNHVNPELLTTIVNNIAESCIIKHDSSVKEQIINRNR